MISFFVLNTLAGAAVGALFGAMLLITDIGGLGTFVMASPEPYLLCAVFIAFPAAFFVPFVLATAIARFAATDT